MIRRGVPMGQRYSHGRTPNTTRQLGLATRDVSEMYQSGVHWPVLPSVAFCRAVLEHPCSAGLLQQKAAQDNTNEYGSSLLWVQEVGSSNLPSPTGLDQV